MKLQGIVLPLLLVLFLASSAIFQHWGLSWYAHPVGRKGFTPAIFSRNENGSDTGAKEELTTFHDRDERRDQDLSRTTSIGRTERGHWKLDSSRRPLYSKDCPFQRNGWNCGKNKRPGMQRINQWTWVSQEDRRWQRIEPLAFIRTIKDMKLGFIGDSLNENFMVSLLCILNTVDAKARKWKRKGARRGGYFPTFNVTVGYHRAVLLSEYIQDSVNHLAKHVTFIGKRGGDGIVLVGERWQAADPGGPLEKLGFKTGFRVDIEVPADEWIHVIQFYDVFVFNTGHWWGKDKFPAESPLLFYRQGQPVLPPLSSQEGLAAVLSSTLDFIERTVPPRALKVWRLQSPRHFQGGDWNQNGSCSGLTLLNDTQVEEWFNPANGGVNKDEREVNQLIRSALSGHKTFELFDVADMSEFRADAHPSLWLGSKDAHLLWGQDCLHWCLPGVPDTWVDMLAAMVSRHRNSKHQAAEW